MIHSRLELARQVVFTYGWERADVEIPQGSSTVEIDFAETTATTTRLRLVHRSLDDLAAGAHHGGWTHYLDRLRRRAEGTTVRLDPFSTRVDELVAADRAQPFAPAGRRFRE